MIGDPSGKDKTREILTPEDIQHNLRAQKELFRRFVDLDNAIVVDNGEWLLQLNLSNSYGTSESTFPLIE